MAPTYSPPEPSRLLYWLMADDGALNDSNMPASDGELVAAWTSYGTKPDVTQSNEANRLTFRENGLQGKPYLEGNKANQTYFSDLDFSHSSGSTAINPFTIFVVTDDVNLDFSAITGSNAANGGKCALYFREEIDKQIHLGRSEIRAGNYDAPSLITAIIGKSANGTVTSPFARLWTRQNRTDVYTVTTSSGTFTSTAIPSTQFLRATGLSNGGYFEGHIYEFLFYEGYLTDEQIFEVEDYLHFKYFEEAPPVEDAPINITQLPVLVIDKPEQPTLVSQIAILSLSTPAFPINITQIAPNVLYTIPDLPELVGIIPDTPLSEIWEWKTVISISESGKEQRSALRLNPRYIMRLNYTILDNKMRYDLNNIIRKYDGKDLLYPFYQYSTEILITANPADTKIYFDASRTDIRDNEYIAVINNQTLETYYLKLSTVDNDGANLATPLAVAIPQGFAVAPVTTWRLNDNNLVMSGISGKADISLTINTGRTFANSKYPVNLTTYDNNIVLDEPILNSAGERQVSGAMWIDNDTGKARAINRWNTTLIDGTRSYKFDRYTQAHKWRSLVNHLCGQQKTFLLPTYFDDVPLTEVPVLGATTLISNNVQLLDYWLNGSFRYVRIVRANGILYRKINEVVPIFDSSGDYEAVEVKLNGNIGTTTGSNIIDRISFMHLCRLGSDRVNITHGVFESVIDLSIRAINR